MQYYESEEMPYMTFSRTGKREDEEGHAFLGMEDRHKERMYATRMLLYFWETHPDTKVWLDGQEFRPTDEEVAEVEEPRAKPVTSSVRADESMPESLVSASVEVEQILCEEDEPRRESIRELMARARKRKERVKPSKGGGGLRAMMK